jgi:hypothetical protein
VREHQGDLPGLPRLSKEADDSWRERVEARLPETLHIPKFEELYTEIYDQFATFDHPNTLGLQVFVHTEGDPVVATGDGEPERDRNLGTIGTMRELERAGRLAVTVGEDGTVNIGVADDETEST